MIKFFRNIRQRLLRENRFSRYLIYAIGEIILVVIGILIALQVNNWNTEKAHEEQRQNQLADLEEEIRKSHLHMNLFIAIQSYFQEMDSILKKIQQNEISEEEYLQKNALLFPIFSDRHTRFIRNDLSSQFNLENGSNILKMRSEYPQKYQQLLYHLKNYMTHLESLKRETQQAFEEQKEFRNFMLNRHDWFYPSDSLSIKKAIDFSINDHNYQSRVGLYRRNSEYVIRAVTALRLTQAIIMAEIERLSGGDVADIQAVFKEFDYEPMETADCLDNKTEITPGDFQFNLLYNSTTEPVVFHRLRANYEIYETFEIASEEFMGFGQSVGMLFQVDRDGSCYQRFKVTPNSYLLIE